MIPSHKKPRFGLLPTHNQFDILVAIELLPVELTIF